MEKTFAKMEEMGDHIKEYVNNRIASAKLNIAEKSSKILANLVAVVVVLVVLFLFVIFASVALAYAFAKLTGELYWGFLIVAGIYLLLGLAVWALKEKWIRLPMMNAMLQQLFNDESNEDQEHKAS